MALLAFPNEILMMILEYLCIAGDVRLAYTCSQLYSLWIAFGNRSIDRVLRLVTPEYDIAVELAKEETRHRRWELEREWRHGTEAQSCAKAAEYFEWPEDFKPPLHVCYPRVKRNDDLCKSACAACEADRCTLCPPAGLPAHAFACSPASFYFLRRLVLAWKVPDLRGPLKVEISRTSAGGLAAHLSFLLWMLQHTPLDFAARQGLRNACQFRTMTEDVNEHPDGWFFAEEVLECALRDIVRQDGRARMAAAMEGRIVRPPR